MQSINSEFIANIRAGKAAKEEKIAALKAISEISTAQAIDVLTALWSEQDSSVAEFAQKTAREIPEENFANFILMEDVTAERLDQLSKIFSERASILEAIILNPTTSDNTIKYLASFCESAQLELILLDKPRISRVPSIVDDVMANPRLTSELRMLIEQDKNKVLGKLYPIESLKGRPAPKLLLTAGIDSIVDEAIAKTESIENDEERERSVYQQLLTMNIPEKIQFAIKGPREARICLIRDANKVVSAAVLKSPKVADSDVEAYAKMRNVSEDILRQIAATRHWMRNQSVVEALAKNPKTPVPITIKLLPRLNKFSVRAISLSKDVPEAVKKMAQKLSQQN
jgi:hypothetical protein